MVPWCHSYWPPKPAVPSATENSQGGQPSCYGLGRLVSMSLFLSFLGHSLYTCSGMPCLCVSLCLLCLLVYLWASLSFIPCILLSAPSPLEFARPIASRSFLESLLQWGFKFGWVCPREVYRRGPRGTNLCVCVCAVLLSGVFSWWACSVVGWVWSSLTLSLQCSMWWSCGEQAAQRSFAPPMS